MANITLAEIQALVAQAAETGEDMTEAVRGGGGGRLLPAGHTVARMISYVEYGSQPQEYQGKAQDPAPEFRLGFALYGPNGYLNEDGTPYKLFTYNVKRSRNEKAGAFLLFKTMNWKGTATHFAQFIGEAFVVEVVNKTSAKPGSKPRSVINLKGFLPPIDLLTKAPYNVPPVREEDLELFLWDYPTLTAWNALFIDGLNEDGTSKNWVQNQILSATDFAGSALESLLISSGTAFTIPAQPSAAVSGSLPSAALPSGVGQPSVAAVQATPVAALAVAALPNAVAAPVVSIPVAAVAVPLGTPVAAPQVAKVEVPNVVAPMVAVVTPIVAPALPTV